MRVNLTKKEIINSIYMQIGFSKKISSNLLEDIFQILLKNINQFKKKLDPRLYNGAILLGLNSPVVKSHGGTDFVGFANAISVCEKIINGRLIEKIKENIN